jgi:hypothetical protein
MAAIPTPVSGTDAELKDAYVMLKASKEEAGKKEQAFDKLGTSGIPPSEVVVTRFSIRRI